MSRSVEAKSSTMYRSYLNELFFNHANLICKIVAEDGKFVKFKIDLKKDDFRLHTMLKREYEIHCTFGSYRTITYLGQLIYV